MEKAKKIIIPVVIALLIIGIGAGGYFFYESANYYNTDNASVSAHMVNIVPMVSGTISSWNIEEGDKVKQGQILGNLDVFSMVSSSKVDQTALENSANSILAKAEVRAPIDGEIVQSNVIKGVSVAIGSTVAVVADTSDMFIKANIEETNIFKIKPEQKVSIKIDAYPGKNFAGYVESVAPATQNAFSQFSSLNTSGTYSKVTQMIPVRISIINDENLPLLIGMNATIKISIK
ncbi:MAG TPA: efflux RND transporter periplasmic adaptor subunit [Anaerovoracaceae bacterium]|nr:efflux RND transporter periplasmic adaptor subunit [Anaerovoracaceae bacterium]